MTNVTSFNDIKELHWWFETSENLKIQSNNQRVMSLKVYSLAWRTKRWCFYCVPVPRVQRCEFHRNKKRNQLISMVTKLTCLLYDLYGLTTHVCFYWTSERLRHRWRLVRVSAGKSRLYSRRLWRLLQLVCRRCVEKPRTSTTLRLGKSKLRSRSMRKRKRDREREGKREGESRRAA